jgi:hypothetical protein
MHARGAVPPATISMVHVVSKISVEPLYVRVPNEFLDAVIKITSEQLCDINTYSTQV